MSQVSEMAQKSHVWGHPYGLGVGVWGWGVAGGCWSGAEVPRRRWWSLRFLHPPPTASSLRNLRDHPAFAAPLDSGVGRFLLWKRVGSGSSVWGGGRGDFAGGHEEVVVHHDRATGLRAIVAIHSTARGAALGGTRFHPYDSDEAALADALKLARAMSYKNALAGLDHGGGKAVIIGDPKTDKSRALVPRVRPIHRVAQRALRHGRRRGHRRRRPRRDARGVPLGHREVARARRRRGLWAADRVGRVPGDAGGRGARVGSAHARRPAGRGRGARQGRGAPRRAPARGRGLGRRVRPWRRDRRGPASSAPFGPRPSTARRLSSPSRWTSTAPMRSAARSTT